MSIALPDPEDPAEALPAVVALRRVADQLENAAVDHAIQQGWSWTQIAQSLGVTKQAAHKRHRKRRDASTPKPPPKETS